MEGSTEENDMRPYRWVIATVRDSDIAQSLAVLTERVFYLISKRKRPAPSNFTTHTFDGIRSDSFAVEYQDRWAWIGLGTWERNVTARFIELYLSLGLRCCRGNRQFTRILDDWREEYGHFLSTEAA